MVENVTVGAPDGRRAKPKVEYRPQTSASSLGATHPESTFARVSVTGVRAAIAFTADEAAPHVPAVPAR